MKIGSYDFNFFNWITRSELVELDSINPEDDPVRPELDNIFRTSNGRKIFGLKYSSEIHGVICVAYTDDIPTTIKELGWSQSLVKQPIAILQIDITYVI